MNKEQKKEESMRITGRSKKRGGWLLAVASAAFCLAALPVVAQDKGYPTKSIDVIVAAAAGGSSDIATRIVVDELSRQLKVPLVVENIAGAAGMAGAAKVLKAKPDGYTILSAGTQGVVSSPIQSPNPPFDTLRDLVPICSYGSSPMIFGVKASSPFKTLEDLIAFAKQNPGKVTCGITNIGGEPHLLTELFKKVVGVSIRAVPHKGTGDAVAALLGGHIDMMVLTYIGFLPYIKSGEARVVAITQKVAGANIPTFADAGYPKVNIHTTLGFYLSAKTPPEIHQRLVPVFEKVVKDPAVVKKLQEMGVVVQYKSTKEFVNELREDWDVVSRLSEEIGLKKK